MKTLRQALCVLIMAGLVGCSSSAPIRYFSLDDGEPLSPGAPQGVRIAVVQVNLPELVDRAQLVVRASGHRVQMSDQDRWAEPLRRQIPRLLARDLGVALNSGRVVAQPVDARNFDVDFKLTLDIQRLEFVLDKGVELDALWRVESRDGRAFFGRTIIREAVEPSADRYADVVAAERRAFLLLARNMASEFANRIVGGDPPSEGTDDTEPMRNNAGTESMNGLRSRAAST